MAKPFKSLLIKLAEKANLPQDNPALLELLGKIDLSMEDTAYDSLNKFLDDSMTLDIAKKHPTVKAHYDAIIFSGIDSRVKDLATEFGLEPADITAIDAEKNSYEKVKLLQKFAKAKTEKSFEGLSKSDKAQLAEEIKKLNADIVSVRDNAQKEISAAKEKAEADTLNYAFDSALGSKKYANKDIPAEVNVLTAKNLLQSELQKRGAKLVRKDGKLALVSATNPELEFIENNKVVSFSDLTDSILANNKLLEVSDPAAPAPVRKTIQQPDGQKQPDTSNIINTINEQLKSLGVEPARA